MKRGDAVVIIDGPNKSNVGQIITMSQSGLCDVAISQYGLIQIHKDQLRELFPEPNQHEKRLDAING